MESTFEIVVHLQRFRNVDLFQQGLYFFSVSVFTLDEIRNLNVLTALNDPVSRNSISNLELNKEKLALPYRFVEPATQLDLGLLRRHHLEKLPARIRDFDSSFCSRVFRVQYSEQEVLLNEAAVFRINLDVVQKPAVYVEFQLYFSEHHSSEYQGSFCMPLEHEFNVVSRKLLRVPRPHDNVHAFYPVTMSDSHFCLLDTMFHSMLLNFHFRPRIERYMYQQGFAAEEARIRHVGPQSMEEALFPRINEHGNPYTEEEVEKLSESLYSYYVNALLQSHDFLVENFESCVRHRVKTDAASCAEYGLPVSRFKRRLNPMPPLLQSASNTLDEKQEDGVQTMSRDLSFADLRALQPKENAKSSCQKASSDVMEGINTVAAQIFPLWTRFVDLLPLVHNELITELKERWRDESLERWGICIFRETLLKSDRLKVLDNHQRPSVHKHVSSVVRSSTSLPVLSSSAIEDLTLLNTADEHVVIFEQTFNKNAPAQNDDNDTSLKKESGLHLIVFVHGYQGSASDMRLLRNTLCTFYPNGEFLISRSNEGKTEDDIKAMSARLALEVCDYITQKFSSSNPLNRLSFISHSLGGVIVRAALLQKSMEPFLKHCFTFFSLGTPHCGYLLSTNAIFDAGMWVLKKWSKSRCLEQLSLTDHEDPAQSFLYKLSLSGTLKHFKNVLLVSSPQDQYAPYHSARIEPTIAASNDTKWGVAYHHTFDQHRYAKNNVLI